MKSKAQTVGLQMIQKFSWEEYNVDDYEKLNDIVEVWFDSGSTHSFVLKKGKI